MAATAVGVTPFVIWVAWAPVVRAAPALEPNPKPGPGDHWAFRPIRRPPLPDVSAARPGQLRLRNPIDAFVRREHERAGLQALPEASDGILLRRLSFDLLGLPPSPDDLRTVQNDPSGAWYEPMVDQMLADPRHGERWARHWMDVWRYSDWWGLGDQLRNSQKHIWHWRDWIVESLNADVSYAEMIRQMLAADELYPDDPARLRATGFLARNWYLFNRNQWLEETVEHVSKGLLAITLNCAKCHEHKYDPIPQVDFYRMRAFFEPYQVRLDVIPGATDLEQDGLPRIYDGPANIPTYRFVRGQESQPDKSAIIEPGVPAAFAVAPIDVHPVELPLSAWQPERRAWVLADVLAAAQQAVDKSAPAVADERRKLVDALRNEAAVLAGDSPLAQASNTVTRATARQAVDAARDSLAVAEATLETARAEWQATQARAIATQAAWAASDAPDRSGALEKSEDAARIAAIRAVRHAALARSFQATAEMEQRVHRAPADRSEAAKKELKTARETLEKARQAEATPVQPEDTYPPFVGARWSATRFLNSTKDDPAVPFPPRSTGRRTALAQWMTDRRNPLTARVAVNHVWMRHFGAPLVATPFDFGRKGAAPANPDLLDWLAAEFIESGWSFKHLHRLIISSSAYRLASSVAGDVAKGNAAIDPDNVQLWRRSPLRLEAEAVRDALLSHAGTLDSSRGGPPVAPSGQAESRRRSLYFFHSNNDRNPFLSTFDAPAVKECYRRDQSIVPQQALALSNSALVQDASGAIATRWSRPDAREDGTAAIAADDTAFVRRAFARMLGYAPNDSEMEASLAALAAWRAAADPAAPSLARAHFIHTLINHNDFVTIR